VRFVVDKAVLGQVFSEYFGFPYRIFNQFIHHQNHPISGRSAELTELDSTPRFTNYYGYLSHIRLIVSLSVLNCFSC
jgi:hypothetical protein